MRINNDISLNLRIGEFTDLVRYLVKQVDNQFPSPDITADVEMLMQIIPIALKRMRPILSAVRNFTPNYFDHLNSLQHSSFIHIVANEVFKAAGSCQLADRLYCTNRSLHSVDLFYKVEMPEVFFFSHALGTVLGNTVYGNYLVVFHNVTVGRIGDARPIIGNNVVLYPGAMVTGGSAIGDNCVISAGAIVHNLSVPDNTVVRVADGKVRLTPRRRDIASLYFRLPHSKC